MIKPILLDDQSYNQILEGAKKAIRKYAPYWTDENAHDPGITLIEMMAWLKEMLQFYMDQTTDDLERQFLYLLGKTTDYGSPSRTVLQAPLSTKQDFLPSGSVFKSGRFVFETTGDQWIEPVKIIDVEIESLNLKKSVYSNIDNGLSVYPFGTELERGNALNLYFDKPLKLGVIHHFYFRIAGEQDFKRCAIKPDDYFEPLGQIQWTTLGKSGLACDVEIFSDETRGLLQSGMISIKLGAEMAQTDQGYKLTAELIKSSYELPPRILNVYNRVFPVLQVHTQKVEPNTSSADENAFENQNLTFSGTGLANQTIVMPFDHVYFQSLVVKVLSEAVEEPFESAGDSKGIWETWHRVSGFELTEPGSQCYVVDLKENAIIFGNNEQGRIPPKGKKNILLSQVQCSFLEEGNISVKELEYSGDLSQYPCLAAAEGGKAPSLLSALKAELAAQIQVPKVAVTAKDYEVILKQTPGLIIRSIKCLPLFRPGGPGGQGMFAENEVTVFVQPEGTQRHKLLNEGYMRNLKAQMQRHRLITTEVHICSPSYYDVKIYCEVYGPFPDEGLMVVTQETLQRLDRYTFGQSVKRSDIYQALIHTEQIQTVGKISISCKQPVSKNNLGDLLIPPGGIALIESIEVNIMRL